MPFERKMARSALKNPWPFVEEVDDVTCFEFACECEWWATERTRLLCVCSSFVCVCVCVCVCVVHDVDMFKAKECGSHCPHLAQVDLPERIRQQHRRNSSLCSCYRRHGRHMLPSHVVKPFEQRVKIVCLYSRACVRVCVCVCVCVSECTCVYVCVYSEQIYLRT